MSYKFKEKLYKGLVQEIKIRKLIVRKKSKFQNIEIFDTEPYGRVLALDGIIQITEKDEAAYSEMLVHPIIQCLKSFPKKILIVGGGDGAIAEELFKYKLINNVDLVDIDKEVVNLSKKYLIKINKNSLKSKRINIFYEDAFHYIKNTNNKYDVIIADRPDPVGAGKILFNIKFYENINRIMSNNSIAVFQSGVPFLQKRELEKVLKDVKKYFKYSGFYLTTVPSYIGGFMALVWASNNQSLKNEKNKARHYKIKTQYYNKDILQGCFAIPNFMKETETN